MQQRTVLARLPGIITTGRMRWWDPQDADKIKHISTWVFHGDQDKVVPTDYSRAMVDAIKKAGGSPKYTEYKDVGHNSWSQTYAGLPHSQRSTRRETESCRYVERAIA